MDHGPERYVIEFDSRLMEDAVMLADGKLHPMARLRFRRKRDEIYRIEDPEERDAAFVDFHHRWFERLDLGGPVAGAVRAHWERIASTRRCLVLPAATAREEDADLRSEVPLDHPETAPDERGPRDRPSVLIRVRAATVVDRDAFERFLDHELLHVVDMLDPGFGYRTELPIPEGGPAQARRVRERYRILWDCTIDGRRFRAGKVPVEVVERRRAEFRHGFPELGGEGDAEFERWFHGPRPVHDDLVRLACAGAGPARSGICPLCRFPYATLSSARNGPQGEALAEIRADFPSWRPEHGICVPCADLYRARHA
jgi:hypothetical protein